MDGLVAGVAISTVVGGPLAGVAAASTSAETHLGCGVDSTGTIPSAVEGGGGWSASGVVFLQLVQRQFKPQ